MSEGLDNTCKVRHKILPDNVCGCHQSIWLDGMVENIFGQKASKIEGLKPLEGTYLGHCLGLSNTLGLLEIMTSTLLHHHSYTPSRRTCWQGLWFFTQLSPSTVFHSHSGRC